MSSTHVYTVAALRCGNCGWSQSAAGGTRLNIPKGQPVGATACPTCGCKTLSKGPYS